MTEYWIRVDVYMKADDLEQACHTVMDALSQQCDSVYLVDGAPASKQKIKEPS
jgi:hypothetical protein